MTTTTMFIPKTQEISDLILIEKTVRTIRRIVKDDPSELAILLKELKKNGILNIMGAIKNLMPGWID